MDLIHVLKKHYMEDKSPSQLKFSDDLGLTIPQYIVKYLKRTSKDGDINPYLLEFFVYKKVYHHLDRGRMYCNDSVSFCDIDEDLVDDALVDQAEEIARKFGFPQIPLYCDSRLDEAMHELNIAWEHTMQRIESNENKGFRLSEDKKEWSLLYDNSEPLDDTFFNQLPRVEIVNLLLFIGDIINIWGGFTHIKGRYIKRVKPSVLALIACVLSEAFGFGYPKMADMSDLGIHSLRSTREDFIRVDTLCEVNDIISNYMKALPIFNQWNLLDEKLLADADGQRFMTTNDTIQSRYSKKHLGKGKGISLYTLVANFVAVNAKNIGLNEYEGHSLYDMVYGNKTDIEIDMVTGDNHSLNKLNFVALDAIDVEYVPSIKNIREAANELYSIKPVDHYKGILRPIGQINLNRIKSQKRGILRVLLSLILQENTQSNIIRKLNSHARYARLKAGLFEYNKLLKSIHILNLIDNIALRKAIRTARNRTEAYHQLQGLIRKIYHGIFKGKKIVDNRISAHATRVIANCIIAYNAMILNNIYVKMEKSSVQQPMIEKLLRISPIAWAHILLTGRYSFKKSKGHIDIANMTEVLEKQLKNKL